MTDRTSKILDDALTLPDSERAELAAQLIESLEEDTDTGAAAEWEAEIARRVAELDSQDVIPIPWSAVRAKLRNCVNGES